MMLRSRQECEDFVRGLCFMAAGGGTRPKEGLHLLVGQLEAGRQLRWVDVGSLPDEAWAATVGHVGGRGREGGTEEELAELGCVEEKHDPLGFMVAAVEALQDYVGVRVEAMVPLQIGGSEQLAAMWELGLPVVDGDYAGGRAIPKMTQVIPEILGVPVCPLSFVTRWGDVVILRDTVSTAMADRIARMMTLASYSWVGCASYLMQIKDVKKVLAGGSLTKALHLGRVIREARERGVDPVAEAVKAVDGWLLFEGEITETEMAEEQSYAFGVGTYKLEGVGSYEGHTFKVWYQNEYHVTWRDDKPFVTSPDSVVMVHPETGEAPTSYLFSVGDRVAIVGRKAHEVHRTEKGIEAFGPRHFRFDFDYVPIEERVKGFGV